MLDAPYFAMLGPIQIVILLALALLIFGPQRLPEIGRQVGAALRELNRMSSDLRRTLDLDDHLHLNDHLRFDVQPFETPTYTYNDTSSYPYSTSPTITAAESTVPASISGMRETTDTGLPSDFVKEAHPAFAHPALPEPPGPLAHKTSRETD